MVRDLKLTLEEVRFKPWEMPVTQFDGLQVALPQLVPRLTFSSVKDYDDWLARASKVPAIYDQAIANMREGE